MSQPLFLNFSFSDLCSLECLVRKLGLDQDAVAIEIESIFPAAVVFAGANLGSDRSLFVVELHLIDELFNLAFLIVPEDYLESFSSYVADLEMFFCISCLPRTFPGWNLHRRSSLFNSCLRRLFGS